MKKIFKILFLAVLATTASCEDVEPTIYNSDGTQSPTFISFSSAAYSLPVARDNDGTLTLVLNSSTVSNVDRTYNLTIDAERSTANPAIYTFPSSITIPAGQYQGFAEATAVDINVTSAITTIVFSISNLTDEYADVESYTVNIFEVCPLEAPFTGTYLVTGEGKFGPVVSDEPVELVAVSDYVRTFDANFIPEAISGGVDMTVNFTLSCGQTSLNTNLDTQVGCSEPNLIYGVGNTPGFYIVGDDSQFTLTLSEDISSSCSGGIVQVNLLFTKQ